MSARDALGKFKARVPLTPELIAGVCAQIASVDPEEPSVGLHATQAAVRLGVPRRTWDDWMKKGRDLLGEHLEPASEREALCALAVLRVEEAEADCEHDWKQRAVQDAKANKRSWAAQMTFLERRFPARYRRPSVQAAVVRQESVEEELDRLTAETH